ncbi:MAG TPA: hypothetical protein VI172_06230, partial [Candidatus Dormibacteraeota bacterium]
MGVAVRVRLSRITTALTSDRLIVHNVVVVGGTVGAGILGVAFQSLVSHSLKPADYGSVFAAVTLIALIGLPASAFTLLMAREVSRGRASGERVAAANLLLNGNRALLIFGLALGLAVGLLSAPIGELLQTSQAIVLAVAIGTPFVVALPLLLGYFQGDQRFSAFAGMSAGQAALKLLAAVALGFV